MILVAYASKHGSTREVAEAVGTVLGADVRDAGEVEDVSRYEAVVLGGSLYTGRLHAGARRFLRGNRDLLARVPVAVFALGPRSLAESEVAESRKQLDRALAEVPEVEPVDVAIFGGAVDPAKLRFPFSRFPASDARDWDAIGAWARALSDQLAVATNPRV
jgi:menaquinone-dependent protoporphyrinogen oxidase